MIDFFLRRIKDNLMTVEDVPPLWREKVRAELESSNSEK